MSAAINNAELYRLIRDQAERLGGMLRTQQVEGTKSRAILEGIADGVLVTGINGEITVFKDGAGSVKVADTVWRAVSDEPLTPGETVVIASVDGATLKVKRA